MPALENSRSTQKSKSISATFFIGFFLLTFVILLLQSVSNIFFNIQKEQRVIYEEQQLIAYNAGSTVQNFIQEKFSILTIAGATGELADATPDESKTVLNRILTVDRSFRQIIFLDANKKEVATASHLSLFSSKLNERVEQKLFSTVQRGNVYASSTYIDTTSAEPMIVLSVPVTDAFGDFKGYLITEVNLKFMWDLVSKIQVGEKGTAYVVDKKGNLLAFVDTSRVLKRENLKTLREVNEFMNNPIDDFADVTSITTGINRTPVISTYVALEGTPDWAVITEIPISEAYQPIMQELMRVIILIIITLAFAIIISIVLSKRITQPIIHLRDAAQKISSGDLTTQIDVVSNNEVGELATAFNQMTVRLKQYYATLEQKIAEKTTQLSDKVNDLENNKKAMMNLMEDLQSDKIKIDEQKRILDSVIHNMPIGVALTDPSGRPLLVNEAGIAILGRGMDPNSTNQNAAEIYQICKADGSLYPVTELTTVIAVQSGKPVTKDDMVIHQPGGRKVALRGTSVPVKNAQGMVVSVISVFEDVTKEREVDRMKTEFISLASHQLRTPLSAIKWFTEMLLGGDAGPLNPEQKDFAQNVSDSSDRMIQLVNALLNISRIESGRIMVAPQPTDLKQLVQGVVNDLQAKIHERNQNLVISVREDLPKINLDPRLISQVYMNLLTNAIKYTPKGGEINVFVSRKGDEVISQVTDNGYGIPKAQQGKIFQKFFRAENIIKVETDGTGLGLYLIKAVIESSKGKIWFQSEEGKGTSFFFTIPITGMEAKKGEVTLD